MTQPETKLPDARQAERLLSALVGVVSARVVTGPDATLREIHILASTEIHPKQVVRNVESALRAGLGIEIDRRVVSVAQMDDEPLANGTDPHEIVGSRATTQPPAPTADATADARVVLVGFDTWSDSSGRATCEVRLRRGTGDFTGRGEGTSTLNGRAGAAARAAVDALNRAWAAEDLALEDSAVVEAHGRVYVLLSIRRLEGRNAVPLTGTAVVTRSPEEAAILAALQATNRRAAFPA